MKFISLFISLFLMAQSSYGQDFITKWTFSDPSSQISFQAMTTDTVQFSWSTTPSGNSGEGSFIQTTGGTVVLNGLIIEAGDIVILEMAPEYLKRFYMEGNNNRYNLLEVSQWGDVVWSSMESAFWGCYNLSITASDTPILTDVTNMHTMFYSAGSLNQNISHWDVSNITDMSLMFAFSASFNQDISNWDVSNVTNMQAMFSNATTFNQDISSWDVSNVTDMSHMFLDAHSFNQDISNWDVSNVTNMESMFSVANSFNQDLSNWDVSNVNDMSYMFFYASSFNQNISNWDVSNVTDMSYMFMNAEAFNQDIGNWDVSNVTNMKAMFQSYSSKLSFFNQNISNWDVSNVTNMKRMFAGASLFNQDISGWNVSNVVRMDSMFNGASSFNRDIGIWHLHPDVNLRYMLNSSGMDCEHYTATLVGWQNNNPNVTDVTLGAYSLEYGTSAVSARDALINDQGWTIEGDEASNMACDGLLSADITASKNISLSLYPNPVIDQLTVKAVNMDQKQIQIYNSTGQNVTPQCTLIPVSNSVITIDLSTVSDGIYFIKTSAGAKNFIKQVH